ncbi:MAG TPA: HAMP domain-containing sensor histidine kinase [Vulgatibacter sp.]|nr:HAMP domain-containing sensor histidine kinase [Vulgatibacter sp.]
MGRSPSLRRAFLLLGTLLTILVLALVAALVVTVVRLSTLSAQYRRALDGDRAAWEIQTALFRAARSHELYGDTGEPRWKAEFEESEARLAQWLDFARQLPKSPEASASFSRLDATTEALRHDVLSAAPGTRRVRLQDFLAAEADAVAFLDVIAKEADQVIDDAVSWTRVAIFFAALGVLAAAVSFPLVSTFTRRLIYLPIVRLRKGLAAQAKDHTVRVPVAGPTEFQAIGADVNALMDLIAARRAQQLAFLSGVAHDLRNPLTALRAAAQLSERKAETEGQRRQVARVLRHVDRMNRLVDDLLDVGRLEAGQFELRLVEADLRDVVRDTCDLYDEASEIHEVRCALPAEPVRTRFDPTRIAQVLANVVSNGIKYAPEGGPVDVRLRTEGSWAVIEVQDRGLGIPPEERAFVFEPFRRSTGPAEGIPGVGLGLSVARRLVHAHGGEIEFESEVGEGSTFRIRLPLGRSAEGR